MAKIRIGKIISTLEKTLVNKNIPLVDAKLIAGEYLEGELQGRESHGLMAFPSLVKKLDSKKENIMVIKKTHAMVYLDAKENLGRLVGEKVANMLIKISMREGVAVAFIKNMITWLRPGTIARLIAEKGFIGIVANNGGSSMVAPPGGYDPVIGTNPIGIGIPTSGNPIVVDMATSARAWGEVRKAEKSGHDLPEKTFLNNEGKFAIKPQDAYSVVPAGGYKGFAIGLLIEILTGSLVERGMGSFQVGDYRTASRGALIIVINPNLITDLDKFKKANTNLIKDIKKSRRLNGVKEIIIPGERALKNKIVNLKRGYLDVQENLWHELLEISGK